MVFESLQDSVAAMFQATWPSLYAPVVVDLDETGMLVSSGMLPLKTGVISPIILPRIEDHNALNCREVSKIKAVIQGTIKLRRNKKQILDSLMSKASRIKSQVPAGAPSSSKAVQPLPPTEPKEKYKLDTAPPTVHVSERLSENVST